MPAGGVAAGLDPAALIRLYRERLIRETDLDTLVRLAEDAKRARIAAALEQMFRADRQILTRAERARIIQGVIDETLGLGPLEPLLADPAVTEVMVVRPDEVYYERDGCVYPAPDVRFNGPDHLLHLIERIIAPLGRRIDESSPLVDARLPDGSRVHAVIPPVALHGPKLTIRRFLPVPWTLADLAARGALSAEMAAFLAGAVRARVNMVLSGGTGSGKTSLLAALIREIPAEERLVTIEDMAELKLERPHVVALEGRPPNLEGRGEITLRTLIRNALRMRPDRIIVGEVRGEEAFDMLQAMNSGHPGSLTTLHANSPADAIARLEHMVAMSGTRMHPGAVREHLASTIRLVLQVERLADGSRKVVEIAEVTGAAGGRLQVQTLYRFRAESGHPAGGRGVFARLAAPRTLPPGPALLPEGEPG